MTHTELIEALQEECRTDRTRVEDFLGALGDICAEELKKGRPFHVGNIGFFALNPRLSRKGKGIRAAIIFQASKGFRRRFGNIDETVCAKAAPGICKSCAIRPGKIRVYDQCDACYHAKGRA